MAKKNQQPSEAQPEPTELDLLKSINEKLAELVDLARANSVNVNAIASVMPKPATHVAGFVPPPPK